jgi:hypothetical protein
MSPSEFPKTLYLGDRGLKSITLDGKKMRVIAQVDEISRIRSESGRWEYYNDENIIDGLLVFIRVRSVQFSPPGPLPNDYINSLDVEPQPDGYWRFLTSVSAGTDTPRTIEVLIAIEAKGIHLEDPSRLGVPIEN